MIVAEVNIWGKLVGAVAWDDKTGYATFEFEPTFKLSGWDLAPLTMPITDNRNTFSFPELRKIWRFDRISDHV